MAARSGSRVRPATLRVAVALALLCCVLTGAGPAPAGTGEPTSASATAFDLGRPRVVWRRSDVGTVRARAGRDPYRMFVVRLVAAGAAAESVPLDDHTIGSERNKAKAAKDLAFLYALDRTIAGRVTVPFPTAAARKAIGDRARDLLTAMYTRSRLAVPPPIGGYDRDINTSEELLQYASAYDTLLGAGYDFGAAEPVVRQRITELAGELHANYTVPATANGYADLLPNNHRSKSAAALGVAALALLDRLPINVRRDVGSRRVAPLRGRPGRPRAAAHVRGGRRRLRRRPLLPALRRAEPPALPSRGRPRAGRCLDVAHRGIDRPNLWRHPLFGRSMRWALDLTRPNGALAPVDDSNIDFAMYFGLAGPRSSDTPAFLWRWAHAPVPYDTDGSVDLAADALVVYDDRIAATPPAGDPSAFYPEGGNAVFRSGWGADDTVAVVNAEHGTAMEFDATASVSVALSPPRTSTPIRGRSNSTRWVRVSLSIRGT